MGLEYKHIIDNYRVSHRSFFISSYYNDLYKNINHYNKMIDNNIFIYWTGKSYKLI